MERLEPEIATLAANRLFSWHREQAKREVAPLRKTIQRLVKAGLPLPDLQRILESSQWQIELASCMAIYLKGEE
jgi:hypothetical protein